MKITISEAKPYEESIYPGLRFELEISYKKYQEAMIGMEGRLLSDDQKIIAELKEISTNGEFYDIAATGSRFDAQFKEDICKVTVFALLDRRALSHIESRRMDNRKGDVELILRLTLKSINNKALLLHLFPVKAEKLGIKPISIRTSEGDREGEIMVTAYDHKFSASYTNQWVLSGKEGPYFLSIKKEDLQPGITIPSSDWIHDFAPKLELGEYFIIEIPRGKETIEKAWNHIEEAEECFRNWDTKGAYAHCREAGTLLNETIKGKFKNNPTIKKWNKTIGRFDSLASLDLHTEDIKKENPEGEIKVGKSDTEHILIVTKALIKYAEELLQEGG